jgi:Family of unknown function (DUF5681)
MAVNSLQKQPARGAGRPFEKGRSGNPAGRPRGARNKATLAAEALFDSEAEALSRKAVELALGGSEGALRLCLDRIIAPRRERPIQLAVPPIRSASDIAAAMGAIVKGRAGHHHARRGAQAEPDGRHLRPRDRYQRLRQAAANIGECRWRTVRTRGRLEWPLSETLGRGTC